jgi:hypothetical protein
MLLLMARLPKSRLTIVAENSHNKGAILMQSKLLAVVIAILVAAAISASAGADEIKVSKLRVAPEKIGADWTPAPGIVVDDLEAPPADKQTAAIVAELKKQVRPLGVRGLADYTYRNKTDRTRQVTVRVFAFDTKDQLEQWIKTKYQFAGWEEKYKQVEDKDRIVFDSLEVRKRIVVTDKLLITVGTIADQDDHMPVLELILANLKEQTKPAEKGAKPPADAGAEK